MSLSIVNPGPMPGPEGGPSGGEFGMHSIYQALLLLAVVWVVFKR